jgi:hypothetical protein
MGIARKKRLLSAAFFRYPKNYLFLFNPYDFFLPPLVTEGLQLIKKFSDFGHIKFMGDMYSPEELKKIESWLKDAQAIQDQLITSWILEN